MSLLSKIITNSFWALLGKLATYPLALILAMVIARVLTKEEIGGYFLSMSIVMLFSVVIQFGMGRTMVKFVAAYVVEDNPKAVRQSLRIGALVVVATGAAVVLMLSNAPGRWMIAHLDGGEVLATSMLLLAGLAAAYAAVEFCGEVLRGFHDLRGASLLADQAFQRFLLVSILLVFIVSGLRQDLYQVLLNALVAAVIATLVGAYIISSHLSKLGTHGESANPREILSHGPPFLLIRLNLWLLNGSAILVLGIFQPPEQVALYGAANVLAALVIAPWSLCNSVLSPTLSALYRRNDLAALSGVSKVGAALAAIPAIVVSIVLVSFGTEILGLVFTEYFRNAAAVLTILAVGGAVSVSCGAPAMIMSMTNHQFVVLKVVAVTSLITVVAYFYFAEKNGIQGVAVVTAVSYASQALLLALVTRTKLGFSSFPMLSIRGFRNLLDELRGKQ